MSSKVPNHYLPLLQSLTIIFPNAPAKTGEGAGFLINRDLEDPIRLPGLRPASHSRRRVQGAMDALQQAHFLLPSAGKFGDVGMSHCASRLEGADVQVSVTQELVPRASLSSLSSSSHPASLAMVFPITITRRIERHRGHGNRPPNLRTALSKSYELRLPAAGSRLDRVVRYERARGHRRGPVPTWRGCSCWHGGVSCKWCNSSMSVPTAVVANQRANVCHCPYEWAGLTRSNPAVLFLNRSGCGLRGG